MNPYPENSKIYYLYEKIRQNDFLKEQIIDRISISNYTVYQHTKEIPFILFNATKYPFLNDYIDEYLKLFPDKIDEKDEEGNNLLIQSIRYNRLTPMKTFEIILKHNPNINLVDKQKKSVLFYAYGNPRIFKILLDHGANPNMIDDEGNTVLLNFIKILCYRGKKINSITKNISLLLKYGADVNHINKDKKNALYLCCEHYDPFDCMDIIIKKLIKYGAKFDYNDNYRKNMFNSLMKTIIEWKKYHVFNLILPNRKSFIQKIKNKYFNYVFIDFKIAQININSFHLIIQFL